MGVAMPASVGAPPGLFLGLRGPGVATRAADGRIDSIISRAWAADDRSAETRTDGDQPSCLGS